MAEKVDSAALVAQAQELRKSAPAAEPWGHGRPSYQSAAAPSQINAGAGEVAMPASHAGSATNAHLSPQDDGIDAENARIDDVKKVAMAKAVMTPAETALVSGGDAKGALMASMQKASAAGQPYSLTGVERWIANPMRKAVEEEDKEKAEKEAMAKGVAARQASADASPILEMMQKAFDAGLALVRSEVAALRPLIGAQGAEIQSFRKALSPVVAGTADSVAQMSDQLNALAGAPAGAPKSQTIASAAATTAPQSQQFQHFQVIEKGVPNAASGQAQRPGPAANIYVGDLRKPAQQVLIQLFRKASSDGNPQEARRVEKAIGHHSNGCRITDLDIETEVINRLGVAAAR